MGATATETPLGKLRMPAGMTPTSPKISSPRFYDSSRFEWRFSGMQLEDKRQKKTEIHCTFAQKI